MTDQGAGGYMNYGDDGAGDFKRKTDPKKDLRCTCTDDDEEDEQDPDGGTIGGGGVNHHKPNGKLPPRDIRYLDIYREKPVKVVVKVLVPIKEHPTFNFVGKLLGPKGNSLRRLQEETKCKMAVMGRGSMKDRNREENLRQSLDPKYAHLNDELHVEISALAPPAEAHGRISYALTEVRKYLIPDSNDEIRKEQFLELVADGVLPPADNDVGFYSSRGPPPSGPHGHNNFPKRGPSMNPRPRSPEMRSSYSTLPAKEKVFTVMDRPRSSMDGTSYNESEDYDYYEGFARPEIGLVARHRNRAPHSAVQSSAHPPHLEYQQRGYGRDRSPVYVKSEPVPHSHRRSAPSQPPIPWRSAPRSHPPLDSDDHFPRHLPPPQRGYPSGERSYRSSPYARHPK